MGKEITFNCMHCGIQHTSPNKHSVRGKFCSIQCQQDYKLNESVKSGKASARTLKRFLLKENGNRCWTCGITEWNDKPIVMELEHIDGNSDNNSLENLSIICPNCHSQTPTYKAKNTGNGRHYRRVRYSEGKSF